MNIPRDFIELLLAKIDIVELINTQVPLRKKSGSNYFARCPFHNEKSASFSVSQPKQFYYCFGCGAHGNAIDFLMQHERMSFPEAIEALARQTGLELPHSDKSTKKDSSLPSLYDLMQQIANYYYTQMCHSERAIHYLKSRSISGNIAQQFEVGYAVNAWSNLLDHFGKTEAERKKLQETGLIIKKNEGGYYDRFRDRIIFPIHDYRGRVIGFGGRILDQGEPKYLNSPETSLFQKGHELYGLYQSLKQHRKLERVLIVEGYMDVIALFQHGITYAVATMGTATTPHHLQRLFRYTAEIIFCFDGDEAGRIAAWRALQVVLSILHDDLQIKFLFLPDGEDPDSLIRKEGQALFEKRIAEALSLSTFFFQHLSLQCDMKTMEGRARFASLALNDIQQISAPIFQGILIDELAKRARIEGAELKRQLQHPDEGKITHDFAQPKKLPSPIRFAIALLIQYPHLAKSIKEPLLETNLPGHTFLKQLIETIQTCSENVTTGTLMEYWRGQKEEKFLAKLAHWQHMVPETGLVHEFLGALRQINILGCDEEINRLLAKGAQENLQAQEKIELTEWINKKKALAISC